MKHAFVFAGLLTGLAACTAADPGGTLSLAINHNGEDGYAIRIRTAGAPDFELHPDCAAVWVYAARGSRLYTVVSRADGERGYHPQVCDLDTGTAVTSDVTVYDSHAGLAPDGRVITAARQADGTIALVLLSADLQSATPLDRPGSLNSDPDWSPDGQYWVYRSDRDGRINLWREHIESGNTIRLTDNQRPLGSRGYGGIGSGRFSPDGQSIAYSCVDDEARSQLCISDADGQNRRQLTHGSGETNAMYPAWHPSGERIVFGADDPQADEGVFGLFEIHLADGEISRVTGPPAGSSLGAVWVIE